jgi:NAD(P)-dependent dehydrogenase (short-subunit alcohol dehydrogenase family)
MFSVNDKVIIVTGGQGLLGKQIVNSLRNYGAIAISGDLKINVDDPHSYLIDITKEASVEQFIANIVNTFGKIDGWVNNAYPRTADWGAKIEDTPFESWRRNVDMHLNGYFLCSKLVLEQMKKQRFGSVINMSSIYGLVGPDFSIYNGTSMTMPVAYSAIKGGVNNLTRYLAAYYGPYQIRVNTVSPGGIFDNQPESFVQAYNEKVPLRRMGSPNDIVSAVHFLLCDETSYLTGHNLIIDGGWTAI